jgi:hypothetical protein
MDRSACARIRARQDGRSGDPAWRAGDFLRKVIATDVSIVTTDGPVNRGGGSGLDDDASVASTDVGVVGGARWPSSSTCSARRASYSFSRA